MLISRSSFVCVGAAAALVVGLLVGAAPARAQTPPPDGHFDWPIGGQGPSPRNTGNNIWVQQNFANLDGPYLVPYYTCGRAHSGADLQLTGQGSAGAAVYAAADGIVLCRFTTGDYPGRVVVIQHDLPDGRQIYSMYGHLAQCTAGQTACVADGATVRRGDQIGTLANQDTNSHLHFEIREFPAWNYSAKAPLYSDPGDSLLCAGRGYAEEDGLGTPEAKNGLPYDLDAGYLNPIDFILSQRPPMPVAAVATGLAVRTRPSDSAPEITGVATIRRVAVVHDEAYTCPGTDTSADGSCAVGTCPALGHQTPGVNNNRLTECQNRSSADCNGGACDWWYEVEATLGGGGDPLTGYVKIFSKGTYNSPIHLGEPEQLLEVGPWEDPAGGPLVALPLEQGDLSGDRFTNQGSEVGLDGVMTGTASFELDGLGHSVLSLDGATEHVEVEGSDHLRSTEAFSFTLRVLRRDNDDEDALVGQWDPADTDLQRWRVFFAPESPDGIQHEGGELRFQVRWGSGADDVHTVRFVPPDCDYLGNWVEVSGLYDPADGIRLYWNHRQVARVRAQDLGGDMVSSAVPLLIGAPAGAAANSDTRLDGAVYDFRLWADAPVAGSLLDMVLIIDSSGSMGWNDPYDKRQDAAKAYLTASADGDYVAVVDFDYTTRVASGLLPIPDAKAALAVAIDTIDSYGGTHIGRGVQAGCNVLTTSTTGNEYKAAILLTDGDGGYTNEAICFADQGWPVYTFGLGLTNGDINEPLLQEIASVTGGQYARLPYTDLVCKFQAVRAALVGGTADPCIPRNVASGETVELTTTVPAGQSQATFSTSWAGSDVVLSLQTPSGRIIDRSTVAPDVVHDVGPTYEVYTIVNPEAGVWDVRLYGADVPPAGESVTFGFSALPAVLQPCDHDGAPGDWGYCTEECPCGSAEGDCNSDAECLPGLFCAQGVGAQYGWDPEVDVCRADCHDGYPGDWGHCTSSCPCGEGLGDCNSDADCLPGLFCASGVGASYGWDAEVDVCSSDCHDGYAGDWGYCTDTCPCPEGLGDCDSDAECLPGLFCVDNTGLNPELPSGIDVCSSDCHNGSPGDWGYCTDTCPCGEGLGDCNSDAECVSTLRCASNRGPLYGWASDVDVCTVSCHDGLPGSWGYCTSSCPCAADEGDCNSDADCESGLTCASNVGAQYGWDPGIDVCQP